MRCSEMIGRLEQLAPVEYACEWDNPGLLAGRMDKEVKKVLLALDATDEVVEQAIREQADLLLTHHPLIFKALKKVNDQDFISRRILKLIQADISYYAMHTNFDIAPGCMADLAAGLLELKDGLPLEVTGEADGTPIGIGKVGTLAKPLTLTELGTLVKERFGLPFVTVYGLGQLDGPADRIAVSPGSGGSMIRHGLTSGAQVLVTGDIGHHEGIDAVANGMAVIDGGHYGLEHIFMSFMENYLKEQFGSELTVVLAGEAFPAGVL